MQQRLISVQVNSRASMKGQSRVFAGSGLPVFWTSDRLPDIGLSVQLLLWRPRERGPQDLQFKFLHLPEGEVPQRRRRPHPL